MKRHPLWTDIVKIVMLVLLGIALINPQPPAVAVTANKTLIYFTWILFAGTFVRFSVLLKDQLLDGINSRRK